MEPPSYDNIVDEKGVHKKEAENTCALQLLNQTQNDSDQFHLQPMKQTQGDQGQCALQLLSQTPIDQGQCSVQLLSQTPGDQYALQPLSAHQLQVQLIQQQEILLQQQQILLKQHQQQLNQVPTQSHRESFVCAVVLSCCVIWTCLVGCICGVVAFIFAGIYFDFVKSNSYNWHPCSAIESC